MLKITWKIYYLTSLFIFVSLLLNFLLIKSPILYIVIGLAYLLYFSFFAGNFFFRGFEFYPKFVFGFLMLLSCFSILGSISYYLYKLSNPIIVFIIIVLPIIYGIKLLKYPLGIAIDKFRIDKNFIIRFFLLIVYFVILIFSLKYLNSKATTDSINTPWKIISANFFVMYLVMSIIILFISYISKSKYILILLSAHFAFSFSIILIIYKLGFGYDPFLHIASEKLMYAGGTFLPKPPYYIGQYSIVVILSKLLQVSVMFFDRILLVFCASLFLPTSIYMFLRDKLSYKKFIVFICILLFLLFNYSNFTYTTPQGLANLFLIILIFLSTLFSEYKNIYVAMIVLVFSIFMLHPISGIPAFLFLTLLSLWNLKIKKVFFYSLLAISCFVMPVAFLIFNYFKRLNLDMLGQETGVNLLNSINPLNIFYARFINIYDFIYLYARNINLLILLCAIFGIILIIKSKELKEYFVYIMMFVILLINYFVMINYLRFPFLYEFSLRIFNMAFYFLLPIIFVLLGALVNRVFYYKNSFKIFIIVLFAILMSASFYLSYPRSDKYENFKGYSISTSSQKAVDYIEINFDKFNYVVLSDQSVGASLIGKYGFRKYYNQEFYYSLPTNIKNNTYSDFLEILQDDSDKIQIINSVIKKTGVAKVFVVINNYWNPSEKVLGDLKKSAKSWTDFDNKKVYIFEY